ncbi:MAG: sulfotransferase domain-containing protein [Lachnospiraceae bacterium]|nr:sulfotransferase domain-containing protein [Lachnospiraceae bacterium]
MAYPDFVCMGFQKCGTTSLYDILAQHPQVALCRDVKEPMYYRVPFLSVIGLGSVYYRKRYFGHVGRGDRRKKGEINAGLTFGGCAEKLAKDFPRDTKMIFMLRNPVDRSYSAYKYFLARGFLPAEAVAYDAVHGHARGFDHYAHSVLDDPGQRGKIMSSRMKYLVFSQSNYAACISDYLKEFDIRNMKFVVFEDFIRDQHRVCREIYEFIGVEDAEGIQYNLRSNEGRERATSGLRAREFCIIKGINYFLYDLIAMPHWAPKLYERYAAFYGKIRSKCLAEDSDRSGVLPSTRTYLMGYFEKDLNHLEKLTGVRW